MFWEKNVALSKLRWTRRDIFMHKNSFPKNQQNKEVIWYGKLPLQEYIPILLVFVNEFMCMKMSHLVTSSFFYVYNKRNV